MQEDKRCEHMKRMKWTKDEDLLLQKAIETIGGLKWERISQLVGTRSGKQCRERWYSFLKPDILNNTWSKEDDKLLMKLHHKYGNKWTSICGSFTGRSVSNIKNRWRTLTRNKKSTPRKSQTVVPTLSMNFDVSSIITPNLELFPSFDTNEKDFSSDEYFDIFTNFDI